MNIEEEPKMENSQVEEKMPAQQRILIVDDDKLLLQSLSNLFIRNNWDVETCLNGRSGLNRIAERQYDCILMDVRMPGLTGTETLEQIRQLESKGKIDKQNVILITGYAEDSAPIEAFKMGAFNYIVKPYNNDDLLKKVNACLQVSRANKLYETPPSEDVSSFKKVRKNYDYESVIKKIDYLQKELRISLKHIRTCSYDTNHIKGNIENLIGIAQIPIGLAGPVSVDGQYAKGDFYVPIATTEGALLLTCDLGMKLLRLSDPVNVEILTKCIHITPTFPILTKEDEIVEKFILSNYESIKQVAEGGSSHTRLLKIERKRVGSNYLTKFIYDTGDAHGLNMINNATYNACKFIRSQTGVNFYHRSHYSGVKHHSLLNEREGYGRSVKASAVISSKALGMLRVTAEKLKDFCDRCIECGHAAEISSVNVHAANPIAAIFMACGQDVADISSSHVCESKCELVNDKKDLYWEIKIKNLLVGTVGGGTGLGTQSECLKIMGCLGSGKSDKFAEIIAATVLASEFPTAAAVVSETYVDIHNKYGRNKDKLVS